MSDEAYSINVEGIWDGYPNGIEGAHYCIAQALHAIMQAEPLELPGLDPEAFHQIVTNHVVMLDVFCMNMLKAQEKAALLELTKKDKKE